MPKPVSSKRPGEAAAVLDRQWNRLQKDWKRVRQKQSIKNVHDLRVSIRRFLAVIDLCLFVDPDFNAKPARRRLKEFLNPLGTLRDIQVQRAWIERLIPEHAILKAFDRDGARKESEAAAAVKKIMKDAPAIPKRVSKSKDAMEKALSGAPALRAQQAASGAVDHYSRRVAERVKKVDPADTATIHAVRLALKRFRYIVEASQPLIGARLKPDIIALLRVLQPKMGEIQDIEVLTTDLNHWAASKPRRVQALKPLLESLQLQKREAIDEVLKSVHTDLSPWKTVARVRAAAFPSSLRRGKRNWNPA